MQNDQEIHNFLLRHLGAIFENDTASYHATTSSDLTLYEWFVTPHRIDGLPFHDFMMSEAARKGTVFGSKTKGENELEVIVRFDLANLHIQRYQDTAIASYSLLISNGSSEGVSVTVHNESRVMVKEAGQWKVVHVHKSPAWPAPHMQNQL